MTSLQIYLIILASHLYGMAIPLCIISGIASVLAFIMVQVAYFDPHVDDDSSIELSKRFNRKLFIPFFTLFLLFSAILVFIPDRNEAIAIYVIPKIMNSDLTIQSKEALSNIIQDFNKEFDKHSDK